MKSEAIKVQVGDAAVSALVDSPTKPHFVYLLAHGAGAGMAHPFLAAIAAGLAESGVAAFRYQFPYMEAGKKRPDPPAVATAVVAAAVTEAGRRFSGVPLFAGGKSFGGRMTSQAAAQGLLPTVCGLAFLGFPLHPPGKPSDERAAHLDAVVVPMLFLQGTRDEFAELSLLRPVVDRLGPRTTLALVDGADHSFHVPVRSGRTDAEVRASLIDTMVRWFETIVATA